MSALKIFNVMIMISMTIGCWGLSKVSSRRELVLGRIVKCVQNLSCPTFCHCLTQPFQRDSNQITHSLLNSPNTIRCLLLVPGCGKSTFIDLSKIIGVTYMSWILWLWWSFLVTCGLFFFFFCPFKRYHNNIRQQW